MNSATDSLKRRLLFLIVLQVLPSHSVTINVERNVNNIIAKTKIPLSPINVMCFLNDMVRLSAPLISTENRHYISKPNGDVIKIKLNASTELNRQQNKKTFKWTSAVFLGKTMLKQKQNYFVFNPFEFEEVKSHMDINDFIVGPLLEEDFGNWVLSTYTKDLDDEWVELFQVITMEIRIFTTLHPPISRLNIGDTFNISFSHPYPDITSCEIVAPRSTYDRFYNRSSIDPNKCGFTIPNITEEDRGIWRIIGVGRIIYDGDATLAVNVPVTPNLTNTDIIVHYCRGREVSDCWTNIYSYFWYKNAYISEHV